MVQRLILLLHLDHCLIYSSCSQDSFITLSYHLICGKLTKITYIVGLSTTINFIHVASVLMQRWVGDLTECLVLHKELIVNMNLQVLLDKLTLELLTLSRFIDLRTCRYISMCILFICTVEVHHNMYCFLIAVKAYMYMTYMYCACTLQVIDFFFDLILGSHWYVTTGIV